MEQIKKDDKLYSYTSDVRDNDKLRASFNALTQQTYGFNFEDWYQKGYWGDRYQPHLLLDGDRAIANVSVNIIEFLIMGEKKTYIQLGTVMTEKDYRKQGLNRLVMDRVLEKWKDKCDLLYLYANDSVLNYYPKFGFVTADQYQYSRPLSLEKEGLDVEKLDMSDKKVRDLVIRKTSKSKPVASLQMYDNESLIMFYLSSFMSDTVYYIKSLDTIAVAEYEGDSLLLYDVFSTKEPALDRVIEALATSTTKKALLGFTPINKENFDVSLLKEDNTTLFVMGKDINIFKENQLMFPLLSRA